MTWQCSSSLRYLRLTRIKSAASHKHATYAQRHKVAATITSVLPLLFVMDV
jgi:hypothetical protein